MPPGGIYPQEKSGRNSILLAAPALLARVCLGMGNQRESAIGMLQDDLAPDMLALILG